MEPLQIVLPEEVALEGLDGITLDTLWFRLSERLKLPLPFNDHFRNEVWKLVLSRNCFEYFEIEADRPTPKKMCRKDFYFKTETPHDVMTELMKSTYFIYSHHPVDHPEIRGSCKEFDTRKQISPAAVKEMSLQEVYENYNQKFVIVANQNMRNSAIIPKNVGREVELNNHAYCILERIGRSRYFGEATSGEFSLNDFIKDSKLLHYFRNTLLKNQLVIRQQLQARIRGKNMICQLFHLPRFHIVVRASNMLLTEKLFQLLLQKPNYTIETSEARQALNVNPKLFALFVKSRANVFEYEIKTPYRSCYPNATKDQYMTKNKKERMISIVRLADPSMDLFKLWHMEDEDVLSDEKAFLDISKQKINRPLIYQVCQKIAESGREGMSQLEIGTYFGLPKLNARAVIRKIQRQQNMTFYMKDVGRQRVSKFVTKDAARDASDEFVAEMTKLLLKADGNTINPPIPIPKAELSTETSSVKISIPLTPSTLKFLKPEPTAQPTIIQYYMPASGPATQAQPDDSQLDSLVEEPEFAMPEVNMDRSTEHGEQSLMPVIVPAEDFSFIDNVEDVSVSMRFLSSISTLKRQNKGIAQAIAQGRITNKVLNRMNAILDILKSSTVLDSQTLLYKLRQNELDLQEKICRKSLHALCSQLADDNFMKIIEVQLKSEKKTVTLLFFGAPNVSFDMRCWHSIIEEQKLQHFINCHQQPPQDIAPALPPMQETTIESKTSVAVDEFGAQSRVYENFPKFMKMKLFHEFLFYLIYAYPKDYKKIPIAKAVEAWARENPKVFNSEPITENITNCYSTEISWKMFVSPLNPQRDYETGWGFLRDIIHRIPLILFVKFTRFGQGNAELQKYLAHPIKSNYLLHFLPSNIRDLLLNGRKYVFVIQDLCKKLCCCGLLQFGAARTKEVDQSFVYLNRNASLLDTTISEDGYLEVSEQEYPVINFSLDSPETVSEYWNKMHEIAMNTRINRKIEASTTVFIEPLYTKPEIQEALKIQTPDSAPLNDNGWIPGDRKGAAGLDKAFLSHLKRNWTRPLEGEKLIRRRALPSKTPRMRGKLLARKPAKKVKKGTKTAAKETAGKIRSKSISAAQAKFKGRCKKTRVSSKGVARMSAINLIKQRAMLAQDVVDKEALKLMKTMRVTWSEMEDKTLLLIKVALKFAFTQEAQSSHYVSACLVRDILHWRTEKAHNKTSKACTRRIQYLMKMRSAFKEQVALYYEELKTNPEFMMKYRNLAERLKKIYPAEEVHNAVKIHLVEMVHRMHQVFYKQFLTNQTNGPEDVSCHLPNSYEKLVDNYTIINPANTLIEQKYFKPKTMKEIDISMLMSLIHSAICCSRDKTSYAYQLFEIYKKFSDANLSAAVSRLKRAGVISINKKDRSKDESILPYSFSPFHLSPKYVNQIASVHVPVDLYDEYAAALKELSASNGSYQMSSLNCGWIFMLSEMISSGKIHLSYDKAEKLVTIDPRMKTSFDKVSENYLRLKNKQQQDASKEKKSVKLQSDKAHDETFVFAQDPTEAFLKMDPMYLHSFCVIKALGSGEEVQSKSWKILEDGECSVKRCVVKDDDKFAENVRLIAAENIALVKVVKKNSKAQKSLNAVTAENFIPFFDSSIQHSLTMKENNHKDFSGKKMKSWKRITAEALVKMMLELAIEPVVEDDCWLGEYKKISRKTEDEVLDEEDLDTSADPIKHNTMSNQLKELNMQGRSSDMFVVNLSTIFVKANEGAGNKTSFDGSEYDETLIPFTQENRTTFAQKIVSESAFRQDDLVVKDLIEELATIGISNTLDIMRISETCEFVQSKGQMGATSSDLLEMFTDKQRLQRNVETLMKLKFIVKVGVVESTLIHKEFIPFWLLDSFYLVRDEGARIVVDDDSLKRSSDEPVEEEPAKKKLKVDEPVASTSAAADEKETKAKERVEKTEKAPLIRKPVRVRPSPWIRVNGTLNRRVLDKWLGTLLNHLTLLPNMMLDDLCKKFNILAPFDVRTLCEFLQTIGSIKLMRITEPETDFFSVYCEPTVEPATFFCPASNVFIVVNQDAMQRLAFFIGRRKYKTPFV